MAAFRARDNNYQRPGVGDRPANAGWVVDWQLLVPGVSRHAVRQARVLWQCTRNDLGLDRHAIAEEFMVLIVAALTGAEVLEVLDELDGLDPLHHLEPEFVLAT